MSKESTALVSMEETAKQELAELSQRIQISTSSFVKLDEKKFVIPGKEPNPGPLVCVVVDFINSYSYYTSAYKSGVVVPPDCHAIGKSLSEMQPLATSPNIQSENCTTCPNFQWGSGANGGKACKTERVLAIVAADSQDEADMLLIKVSPTGTKHFDKYIADIANRYQATPWQVITEIAFDPKEKYSTLRFGFLKDNRADAAKAFGRKAEATAMLQAL